MDRLSPRLAGARAVRCCRAGAADYQEVIDDGLAAWRKIGSDGVIAISERGF
jgi:hypothetical protein